MTSALEDAARRYARAVVVQADANGRAALELLLEREAAEHDLLVAAGERCPFCDEGDEDGGGCPGAIIGGRHVEDTLPL
jgi:hypothetical protein